MLCFPASGSQRGIIPSTWMLKLTALHIIVIALQAIFSDRGRCAATSSRHLSRSCKPAAPQRHAEIKCGFPSAFIRCQFVQDVTPRSNLEPALTAFTSACLGPESRARNKRKINIHETPARPRARAQHPRAHPPCHARASLAPTATPCTSWEHKVILSSWARKSACSILDLLPRTLGSAFCCLSRG